MKKNMGTADRVIRVAVAATIAVLFFTKVITGIPALVLGIAGGIFLLTSLIGFCPLYLPLGINTCKKN